MSDVPAPDRPAGDEDGGLPPGQQREMLDLQERRTQAMCDRDVAALADMLDDALVYVHANGAIDDKSSFLELIKHPARRYLGIDYADSRVVALGQDGRVVTGRAVLRLIRPSGEHAELRVRYSTAYARRGPRWRLVTWQATALSQ